MIEIQTRPVRPKCQCQARAEAMKRAASALLIGDFETVATEKDFIQQSLAEDKKAMKDWMEQLNAYYRR